MDVTSFIRRMPKAELHVHLESTMEPALRLELARRNEVDFPYTTSDEIAATYVYPDIMMWFVILNGRLAFNAREGRCGATDRRLGAVCQMRVV